MQLGILTVTRGEKNIAFWSNNNKNINNYNNNNNKASKNCFKGKSYLRQSIIYIYIVMSYSILYTFYMVSKL